MSIDRRGTPGIRDIPRPHFHSRASFLHPIRAAGAASSMFSHREHALLLFPTAEKEFVLHDSLSRGRTFLWRMQQAAHPPPLRAHAPRSDRQASARFGALRAHKKWREPVLGSSADGVGTKPENRTRPRGFTRRRATGDQLASTTSLTSVRAAVFSRLYARER